MTRTGARSWLPGTGSPMRTSQAPGPPPGYQLAGLGDATLLPGLTGPHMRLASGARTDPAGHVQAVSDETLPDEARTTVRSPR